MKRGILTCLAVLTLSMASSISVLAAPEIMPDGGVFDAEYYAENNPDVVAVLGTDKDALYSHYVNNGRAEGRQGFLITKDMYTTCPVPSEKSLELLASGGIEGVHYITDGYTRHYRLGDEWHEWGDLALERTDFPDGLIDLDGNGLDDRDPINSLGFIDLNLNGLDDRYVRVRDKENDFQKEINSSECYYAMNYLCEHGVVCKKNSSPIVCPACEAVEEAKRAVIARRYSGHVSEDNGYKVGDRRTIDTMNSGKVTLTYMGKDRWVADDGTEWMAYLDKDEHFRMMTSVFR